MSEDFEREQRAFREALTQSLESEAFRPLDAEKIIAASPSRRMPSRWAKGLAAAASVALVVGGAGIVFPRLLAEQGSSTAADSAAEAPAGMAPQRETGAERSETSTVTAAAGASPDWQQASLSPLSARVGVAGAWLEGRFYLVGGRDSADCPDETDCPSAPDGAAWDPGTDTWSSLPDSPVAVSSAEPAVVGGRLFYLGDTASGTTAFTSYDPATTTWQTLAAPSEPERLVAAGSTVVSLAVADGASARVGEVFEPESGQWSELPTDPSGASTARSVVWTGDAVLLVTRQSLAGEIERPKVWRLDAGRNDWVTLGCGPAVAGDPVLVGDMIVWPDAAGGAEKFRWVSLSLTGGGSADRLRSGGLAGVTGVVSGGLVGVANASGSGGNLYDIAAGNWIPLEPTPVGDVAYATVVGGPQGLLVAGGDDGTGRLAVHYRAVA